MARAKYCKADTIEHWRNLPDAMPILPHMRAIPYKAEGSTYGACGIRIDGNPAFIDAVLSRLKDLLAGEGIATRLGLSRNAVDTGFKPCLNAAPDAECCYIRLHERGMEGQMLQAFCAGAAERNAARQGLVAEYERQVMA